MIEHCQVQLWDNHVGDITWNNNICLFKYTRKFIEERLDISPIQIPISKGDQVYSFPNLNPETYHYLPGLIADSLPDRFGSKLIDLHFKMLNQDPISINPVERLSFISNNGMGALQFKSNLEIDTLKIEPRNLHITDLIQSIKEIFSNQSYVPKTRRGKNSLDILIQIGTVAGGARAKAIVNYNQVTKEIQAGSKSKDFVQAIIKFGGIKKTAQGNGGAYGQIEYAYYLMARDAGINIMDSWLLKENGQYHFITKRFDRIGNEKLHIQTLCALEHFDYNDPLSYSYEQAFKTIEKISSCIEEDKSQLFRRLVFNTLSMNCDDHTKNISFIMNRKGEWRLSPAYDVTFAYDPDNKWLKQHQMSINGRRSDFKENDFITIAQNNDLKDYISIIEQVRTSISKWNQFAEMASLNLDLSYKFKFLMRN